MTVQTKPRLMPEPARLRQWGGLLAVAVGCLAIGLLVVISLMNYRESRRAADDAAIETLRRSISQKRDDLKIIEGSKAPNAQAVRDGIYKEIDWCEQRVAELMKRRYGDTVPQGYDPLQRREDVIRASR